MCLQATSSRLLHSRHAFPRSVCACSVYSWRLLHNMHAFPRSVCACSVYSWRLLHNRHAFPRGVCACSVYSWRLLHSSTPSLVAYVPVATSWRLLHINKFIVSLLHINWLIMQTLKYNNNYKHVFILSGLVCYLYIHVFFYLFYLWFHVHKKSLPNVRQQENKMSEVVL